MIVNTRRLFCRLLRTFDIATVCDVGSMDGNDALRFRRALPSAAILALEPNPKNFALMAADDRLRDARIRVLPVAASDRGAEAPFFVIDAEYARGRDLARRGMSSLHERSDWTRLSSVVQVPTARLDELLAAESLTAGPVALWIDTEGAAFEVIRGASGVLRSTAMIHVEVETAPVIGAAQKVFADVERALLDAGFALLATDQPPDVLQFNALFVRADVLQERASQVRRHLAAARLDWNARRAARRLLPQQFRRVMAHLIDA